MTPPQIIALIRREVKPALGCTEPIAVALAVAKATEIIRDNCSCSGDWRLKADFRLDISVSGNILKNGMGVGIPGTGMVGLIIVTSVIISVIFIIFRLIPRKKKNRIFLSVTGEQNIEMNLIKECLSKADKTYRVQSRNLSKAGLSLVVEMKTDDPDALIQSINEISGVQSISVVSGAENTML